MTKENEGNEQYPPSSIGSNEIQPFEEKKVEEDAVPDDDTAVRLNKDDEDMDVDKEMGGRIPLDNDDDNNNNDDDHEENKPTSVVVEQQSIEDEEEDEKDETSQQKNSLSYDEKKKFEGKVGCADDNDDDDVTTDTVEVDIEKVTAAATTTAASAVVDTMATTRTSTTTAATTTTTPVPSTSKAGLSTVPQPGSAVVVAAGSRKTGYKDMNELSLQQKQQHETSTTTTTTTTPAMYGDYDDGDGRDLVGDSKPAAITSVVGSKGSSRSSQPGAFAVMGYNNNNDHHLAPPSGRGKDLLDNNDNGDTTTTTATAATTSLPPSASLLSHEQTRKDPPLDSSSSSVAVAISNIDSSASTTTATTTNVSQKNQFPTVQEEASSSSYDSMDRKQHRNIQTSTMTDQTVAAAQAPQPASVTQHTSMSPECRNDKTQQESSSSSNNDNNHTSVPMITAELVNEPIFATQVTAVLEEDTVVPFTRSSINQTPTTTTTTTTTINRNPPRTPLEISHVYYDEEGTAMGGDDGGGDYGINNYGSEKKRRKQQRRRRTIFVIVFCIFCSIPAIIIPIARTSRHRDSKYNSDNIKEDDTYGIGTTENSPPTTTTTVGPTYSYECFTSTSDLGMAQLNNTEQDLFVICPNTTISIGSFANPTADDITIINGDVPLMVYRSNIEIRCGLDGLVTNHCALTGGFVQMLIQPWLLPIGSSNINDDLYHDDLMLNQTDNVTIRGITFTGKVSVDPVFSGTSVSISNPGQNFRMIDCLWENITSPTGLVLVGTNPYQILSGSGRLPDRVVDVVLEQCTFRNIVYDGQLVVASSQNLTLKGIRFENVQLSRYLQGCDDVRVPWCQGAIYCLFGSVCTLHDICVEGLQYAGLAGVLTFSSEDIVTISGSIFVNDIGLPESSSSPPGSTNPFIDIALPESYSSLPASINPCQSGMANYSINLDTYDCLEEGDFGFWNLTSTCPLG